MGQEFSIVAGVYQNGLAVRTRKYILSQIEMFLGLQNRPIKIKRLIFSAKKILLET